MKYMNIEIGKSAKSCTLVQQLANIPVVIALESSQRITVEVGAKTGHFIGSISAVVCTVAQVSLADAQVVVALIPRLRAVPSSRVPRRTVHLVGQVATVAIAIATEIGRYAVAGCALECT